MIFHLLGLASLLFRTAPDGAPDEEEEEELEEEEDGSSKDEEEGEPIRDPEKQALSHEAGRWRKKLRAAEAQIKELETTQAEKVAAAIRGARLETAFLRVVFERDESIDVETAWDLANVRGFLDAVKIGDDGSVDGMTDAIDRVLARYPWLADEPIGTDDGLTEPLRRTASPPMRRPGTKEPQFSREQLQKRLPALRKHR